MKVNELLDDDGPADDPDIGYVWDRWHDTLDDVRDHLKKFQGDETSHSIGGNFRATVSGRVATRKNYHEHGGRYGISRTWDYMLEVGNNLTGGKKALDEVRAVLDDFEEIAKREGVLVTRKDDFITAKTDKMTISAKAEYARSFCWVGIRISK